MRSLAHAWGGPVAHGRLRVEPADFRVDEVLGFEPGGGGEHAWLWVRKQDANSEDVAVALAGFAGVARAAVSYSGMKDRRADTGQWFSVHLPGRDDPDWTAFDSERWQVRSTCRHGRKLRTGTHRSNRFVLRIRDLDGDREGLAERLGAVAEHGFPNYFGPQRFGRAGENVRKARRQLAGGGRRAGRRLRGLYLSAARSWLFNLVLDRRVADGTWCTPLPGDALMLAGTHSIFECTGAETDLGARIRACDLDVTGPLWGGGQLPVGADVAAREHAWLDDEYELRDALAAGGMRAARRALRAPATELAWSIEDDALVLAFVLPRGSYATSLVRELVQDPGGWVT